VLEGRRVGRVVEGDQFRWDLFDVVQIGKGVIGLTLEAELEV